MVDQKRVEDGLRALRCLEVLNGEFSLFTLTLAGGRKQVCVQDTNCERKFDVSGVDLLDALSQAASVVALDQAAAIDEAAHAALVADTEAALSPARDTRDPEDDDAA